MLIQSEGEAHGQNPRALAVMIVVTVCGNADENCPVLPPRTRKFHWPLADPAKATGTEDEIVQQFRKTQDEIKQRVRDVLDQLASGDEL